MDQTSILAFALTFFVWAVSPGPANMTIVARTLSSGHAHGIAYGAGTVVGILIVLVAATFGLSTTGLSTSVLTTVLFYAGAAYSIWTGISMWRASEKIADLDLVRDQRSVVSVFASSLALNLGNPKMPLFYMILLPNIVGRTLALAELGILSCVVLLVEIVVVGGHVLLAGHARQMLRTPQVVRWVNRSAALVMIGAGMAILLI